MIREVIATGKTVALALEAGAAELGRTPDQVQHEVLEEGKKGLFGIGAAEAKVRVFIPETPAIRAVEFLEKLIENMRLNASVVVVSETEEEVCLNVVGQGLGALIGRRGDVLDSVQYLATLSANLGRPGYYRVSVDAQGYRAKRADTLCGMARRMAEKVLKYHRAFALEPMSAYERRIVHAECQNIEGVTTYSVGEGADRKIVIAPQKD
ncbi:MAG: Jag N-terminal domain-containing protein [Clostridia bacterium]|jgi:spoIIIJ-associated protein|nr:Jag N-terminal domain-containing protein [Clostridia bacterium]MBQ1255181.1 Jag N-terminal domain-containing protein [Clostridia bacterium]MBQ2254348.1 Jag N-terminal domain-containing protein [Clostridia bacterium]MBQ5791234.1 Jag N-terminal domain-containing protein [Clostridia bacterium]